MEYRLNPCSALHWRRWDDEWVVFDAGSGHTHQMDALTGVVLMRCGEHWTRLSALLDGVVEDLEIEPSADLSAAMTNICTQLVGLGLIEPSAR